MTQLRVEEIDLIPHPMDAWRAALNALIACAPGDEAAIAWHLADAQAKTQIRLDRSLATPGARQIVDRLMLLGAGQLIEEQQKSAICAPVYRKVTNRLTVVVNGTDYDVSGMPGVLVGDVIRIDPNNLPLLDRGFASHHRIGAAFQPLQAIAQPAAGTRAAPGLPGGQGSEQLPAVPADAPRGCARRPATAAYPAPSAPAETQQEQQTPAPGTQP